MPNYRPASITVAVDPIFDASGDLVQGTGADTAARLARGTALADRLVNTSTSLAWVPHVIRKTADESTSTDTTLSNDTDLFWAVGTSEVWFFQGYILYTAANTAMDLKLGWSVPASTTMRWGVLGSGGSAATFAGFSAPGTGGAPVAILTEGNTLLYGTAANTAGASVAGFVYTAGTSGNVNFQWAQSTSDAGTLTVENDSSLLVWRVA